MTKKLVKSKLRVSIPDKDDNGQYTWEKKIEVVTKYMALGNFRLVGELTRVEYRTLMNWRKEPWWMELVDEIKKTRQTELNSKLSTIVDKSLETISDRLENGDIVLNNKTGELVRKPVSLKDANTVTKDLLAHQHKQEELINKIQIQKESVQDQLKLLAGEFAKWSRSLSKKEAIPITFKETEHALHEEWEEGLQKGSGALHEQTFSSEEESRAE